MRNALNKLKVVLILVLIVSITSSCSIVQELTQDKRKPVEIIQTFPENIIELHGYKGANDIKYSFYYTGRELNTIYNLNYSASEVEGIKEGLSELGKIAGYQVTTDKNGDSISIKYESTEETLIKNEAAELFLERYVPDEYKDNLIATSILVDVKNQRKKNTVVYEFKGPTEFMLTFYRELTQAKSFRQEGTLSTFDFEGNRIMIDKSSSTVTLDINLPYSDVSEVTMNAPIQLAEQGGDNNTDSQVKLEFNQLSQLNRYSINMSIEPLAENVGSSQVYNEYIINDPYAVSISTEIYDTNGKKKAVVGSIEKDGIGYVKLPDKAWREDLALKMSEIQMSSLYLILNGSDVEFVKAEVVDGVELAHYRFKYASFNERVFSTGDVWFEKITENTTIPVKGSYEKMFFDEAGELLKSTHIKINFSVFNVNEGTEIESPKVN